jgi:hypothetical protein
MPRIAGLRRIGRPDGVRGGMIASSSAAGTLRGEADVSEVGQLFRLDRAALRQGMGGAHRQHPLAGVDRGPVCEVRLGWRHPVDQHVDRAIAQPAVRVEDVHLAQRYRAAVRAGLERRDQPVQRFTLGGGGEPDPQLARSS